MIGQDTWLGRALAGTSAAALSLAAVMVATPAQARSLDDCQLAWSKAVRSYLTKNRTAGPDGQVPSDMDGMEAAAQAWLTAFRPACEMEAEGDKGGARVEAAVLGLTILARLDMRGCARFLEYFMQSTRSAEICRAANTASTEELRDRVARTIPAR